MKRWLAGLTRRGRGASLAQRLSAEHPLPSFPQATMEALRLLRDPTATPEAIAASIEQNPGLVIQLLRTVNSAAYGLRREVTRTSHAINLLGRTKVESIVVAVAVQKQLDGLCRGELLQGYWHQAALRASLARGFAKVLHPETQSESFVSAMLLDMALPLLASAHPAVYRELLPRWYAESAVDLAALEREALGCDHAEVGAEMARQWELPRLLCDTIAGHHAGGVAPAVGIAASVRAELDVEGVLAQAAGHGLAPALAQQIVGAAAQQATQLAAQFR